MDFSKVQISVGTDPEVFLIDGTGAYVSGHDLIPGTKEEPFPVTAGAVQVDGVALEFNTVPVMTADRFVLAIKTVMDSLTQMYQEKRPDLTIALTPTATFSREYFDSLPEHVKELGCQPDFDAYTGDINKKPETDQPFRTGAGHIHVGWGTGFSVADDVHVMLCRSVVRQLDAILYPASMMWDADSTRRQLYGKMGSFRPKSYGVEYRPLSNAYLTSEAIQKYVFECTRIATTYLLKQNTSFQYDAYPNDVVELLLDGGSLSKSETMAYLEFMSSKYGFPACPV